MTEKTIGQEEDEAAFQRFLDQLEADTVPLGKLAQQILVPLRAGQYLSFLAGKAYGLSLRGCCEDKAP